eukprot:scaffold866_cov111-Isochrysis_galbana.AAC.2
MMIFDGVVVAHGGPPRGHSGDPRATDMNGLARSVKTKTLAASAHFFSPRFSASLQGESDRPISSDVGWVLATEDAGEGVAHGGARSSGGEREGVAEGAPTAPRVDVTMPALGVGRNGHGLQL